MAEPVRTRRQRERPRPRWVVWVAIGAGVVLAAGAGAVVARVTDSDRSAGRHATGSSCAITTVADQGLPSVVMITVMQGNQTTGTGSGEVIRSDGEILTNNHVISAAANGNSTISVRFNDGRTADAHTAGRDPQTDLAVIKLDGDVGHLQVIPFGRSADVRVGERVIALGAPLGFPDTVTSGIVSALGRSVQVPSDGGTSALLTP